MTLAPSRIFRTLAPIATPLLPGESGIMTRRGRHLRLHGHRRPRIQLAAVEASGTFVVDSFSATDLDPPPRRVTTALPVGVATMVKHYQGEVSGSSSTLFTSAFDQGRGVGTYVALESFDGSVNGVHGTFNFVHGATTAGADRTHQHFLIVPSSGTDGLASIHGSGGLSVEPDGTHRIWFEYQLD
jgi:hypothetical protein